MVITDQKHSFNTQGKNRDLGTFFCLYIAQAIPMSFFSTALQVLMRQADYSLTAIALLQIVKIPWILKCFWSPLIDRYCVTVGDYKRCIIVSEGVYALMILLAGTLNPGSDFYFILVLVFLSLAASATQDISTDALAVLSFRRQDKSLVNSMQSMGNFGGTLIGSGVLLLALQHYGWHTIIPCLCIFVLLALIPLIANKRITIKPKKATQRARVTDFIWFFTRRSIWRQIGFLILYYSPVIGILSILRPYMVDLGYSLKEIGLMSGILGTASAFLASFAAGFIVRRMGCSRARVAFALFILLTALYFMGISWTCPSTLVLCTGITLLWGSYGMATIVVYTTAMNCVRPGREGTDFTIQTVLTHLSGILVALLSGIIADETGYHGLFLLTLLLASASLIYILSAFRNKTEKKRIHEY